VLLTDGQVANEDEVLARALEQRGRARVFTFGIGTNVSDALLLELSRRTGGAMEWIHPGERLDEKVVAQFARAVAARVEEVEVMVEGVEASELSPEPPPALVDGEVWSLLGRYREPGKGRLRIRGRRAGQPFELVVPFALPERSELPHLEKLWAGARIRDAELELTKPGRAQDAERRIQKLALEHGVASRFTSFVVVEERSGARQAREPMETRVVPVNLPAGWQMFEERERQRARHQLFGRVSGGGGTLRGFAGARNLGGAMAPLGGKGGGLQGRNQGDPMVARAPAGPGDGTSGSTSGAWTEPADRRVPPPPMVSEPALEGGWASAPVTEAQHLLERQLASGLWDDRGPGAEAARRLRATASALLELRREGVDTSHPVHGAQVRKAVVAVVVLAASAPSGDAGLAELALCAAWLASTGRRSRGEIEQAARERSGAAGWGWPGDAALTRRRAEELRRALAKG
jgi:Ca-activated chloride channel family protein